MAKPSKIFGYVALGGAALFFVGIILAIALFDRGAYSPASSFVTELGQYKDGYLTASSALYFNIGMVIFGLTFGLFMVWRGIRGDTMLHAAVGFTGALTGVLAAAQGIFTLNYSQYHYAVVAAFYFAAFVFCGLQIAMWLKGKQQERFGLALLILFFAAGALCLTSGIFTALGGFGRAQGGHLRRRAAARCAVCHHRLAGRGITMGLWHPAIFGRGAQPCRPYSRETIRQAGEGPQ